MYDYLKSAAQRLLIDFKESSSIDHNLTKGESRESSVIKHFLRPYIARRYKIGNGIIIDSDSNQSRQQDVVIYDEFGSSTLKDLENTKLFFPETVTSIIEVKSTLNSNAIKDTFKKAESIYNLSFSTTNSLSLTSEFVVNASKPPILCCGFAFTSPFSLERIRDKFREQKMQSNVPSVLSFICIMEDKEGKSGIITHANGTNVSQLVVIPDQNSRLAIMTSEESGDELMQMYLLLNEYLQKSGLFYPSPNYLDYAEKSGFNSGKIHIAREDLKGAVFEQNGQKISLDNTFRLSKLTQKLFAEGLSDKEAMDYMLLVPTMPSSGYISHPATKIYKVEKGKDSIEMDTPRPSQIIQSILKIKKSNASEADYKIFRKFKEIIDKIGAGDLTIEFTLNKT